MVDDYVSQRVQDLISKNEELEVEVERLQEKIKSYGEEDYLQIKGQREELKHKVELLSVQLNEREHQQATLDSLKKLLEINFNVSHEKVKESSSQLLQSLQSFKGIIAEKDAKMEQLQELLKENTIQKQFISTQLANMESENKKKGSELSAIRLELESLRKERDELLQSACESKGGLDVLQKHVDQLLADHDSLILENEELRRVAKGLPSQKMSLDSAEVQQYVATQVAKANAASERNLKAHLLEKESLRKEIESLKRDMAASQSAVSIAASFVPSPSKAGLSKSENEKIDRNHFPSRVTRATVGSLISSGNFSLSEVEKMIEMLLDDQDKNMEELYSEMEAQKLSFSEKETLYRTYIKCLEDEKSALEARNCASSQLSSFSFPISNEDAVSLPSVYRNVNNEGDSYPASLRRVADSHPASTSSFREEIPFRPLTEVKTGPRGHRASLMAVSEHNMEASFINCPRCTFQQSQDNRMCSICGQKLGD